MKSQSTNNYAWGMLAVVGVFLTAIALTVVLPNYQMFSQIQPTLREAHLFKMYYTSQRVDSGWVISDPLNTGSNIPNPVGRGRVVFEREGCYFCHTMMVMETVDWPDFGSPEPPGWWWGQRPPVNANENTGPDLQHTGSRLPSHTYLIMHERYPRLALEMDGQTQHPASVMPDFYWLTNKDLNAVADFLQAQK